MPERRARQGELAPRVFGRCRLCGNPAQPPRRYWCSQECVDAWMARSNPAVLRRLVLARDRGVCAGCGVDTIALDAALSAAALGVLTLRRLARVPGLSRAVEVYAGDVRLGVTYYRAGRRFRMRLRDHLRDVVRRHLECARSCPCAVCAVAAPWRWRPGRTLWEADHIWPLAEGGPLCGPEGMRTLCVRCHRRETADLAARRAAANRRAST